MKWKSEGGKNDIMNKYNIDDRNLTICIIPTDPCYILIRFGFCF